METNRRRVIHWFITEAQPPYNISKILSHSISSYVYIYIWLLALLYLLVSVLLGCIFIFELKLSKFVILDVVRLSINTHYNVPHAHEESHTRWRKDSEHTR